MSREVCPDCGQPDHRSPEQVLRCQERLIADLRSELAGVNREVEAWRALAEYGSRKWHHWQPPYFDVDHQEWKTRAHGDPAYSNGPLDERWTCASGYSAIAAALDLATKLNLLPKA